MAQRVLITGHRGYIGSVMASRFIEAGHQVVGLDTGYFDGCTLVADPIPVLHLEKDIRDGRPHDLEGFDAVVHLAALSNDPIGNLNDSWTESINLEGSARLALMARTAGVQRFLFSSSCIMYGGSGEAAEVNEDSPLDPKTTYARSKVLAEQAISGLATPDFSPVFLRNGTVYGLSPRMRFDTVLNSLAGAAVTAGKVTVYSDGAPWRPVVHIEDVASVFLAVLEAPRERIHNQALNAAAATVNHQIRDLARITAAQVPGCQVEFLSQPDADQRTYKTNFDRIRHLLPEFRLRWSVEEGGGQLISQFRRISLTSEQFHSPQFTRLKWLRHLIDTNRLNSTLRWQSAERTLEEVAAR